MKTETDIELPAGTIPLENQVAGHRKGMGSMVNGQIMKHVQRPPKGMREVEFYRRIFNQRLSDPILLQLRYFIPRFHGTVPEGPTENAQFFKMEDLTHNYRKPCITDIKLGKFTYDPYASDEKKRFEVAKYPPVLNLGFQILGMRVYKASNGQFDVYDRKYGRSLNEDEVLEKGLAVFFNGQDLRKEVIKVILTKMKEILAWFESQKQLSFYASSLLLIYEGDNQNLVSDVCSKGDNQNLVNGISSNNPDSCGNKPCVQPLNPTSCTCIKNADNHENLRTNVTKTVENQENVKTSVANNDEKHENPAILKTCVASDTEHQESQSPSINGHGNRSNHLPPFADVKMIDFAHTFDSDTQDENYLFGLRNLIGHIEQLLDK